MSLNAVKYKHLNGSVGTDPEKFSISKGIGRKLIIQNTHATQVLEVSFNGGATFFSIPPGTVETPFRPLELDALFHFFWLRGSGAATTFEALLGEG